MVVWVIVWVCVCVGGWVGRGVVGQAEKERGNGGRLGKGAREGEGRGRR